MNAVEQSSTIATEHAVQPTEQNIVKRTRTSDLHAFQAKIAQKIAIAQTSQQVVSNVLALQVGGYGVHIDIADIGTLLTVPPISAVPLARQWLIGLAVVDAQVVTVIDLAFCIHVYLCRHAPDLALPPHTNSLASSEGKVSAQTKLLVISPAVQNQVAIKVDKVFGIVGRDTLVSKTETKSEQIDSAEMSAIKQTTLAADGMVFIELSLAALFKSTTFLAMTY